MDKIEELLNRRVDKIYPSKEALEKVLRSGKKLRLYLGIDPTAIKLHLGHTVPLKILQAFADMGHETILLFGTGTVLVGDPSERKTGRKLITQKEIDQNIATWKDQVSPIIDLKKVKIKYNGDWLLKLGLREIIKIFSKISSVQLFKRENFTRRIKAGDTVWYHETMYPVLQGYDSVAMNVDLEIGGTDQTFNMLIGRELQRKINKKEKLVLTNKMIAGTDGKQMSKTSRNCIWLTDTSKDMFGKIMSISDELIGDYFEFFTAAPMERVNEFRKKTKNKVENPMKLKKQLAHEITKQFHGKEKAGQAQKEFEKVYQSRGVPEKIETKKTKAKNWPDLLVELNLASSKSEAKRLIDQKAVKADGETITNINQKTPNSGATINVGKRKWMKIND